MKNVMVLSLTLLSSMPQTARAEIQQADATLIVNQAIPVDITVETSSVSTHVQPYEADPALSDVADHLSEAADDLALQAAEAQEAVMIQKIRMRNAVQECEESAGKVSDAAVNLGSAAADFASDAAALAAQTARLAKERAVVVGSKVGEKALTVGATVERKAEIAAHQVASTAENVVTSAGDFTTAASVSAVSQIVQAGNATVQYADKLLFPVLFTALGLSVYKKNVKPYLPSLDASTQALELQHPSLTTVRETAAGLAVGGVMFASAYSLLANPKVANYLVKNMPNTASILYRVINRECKLVNDTFTPQPTLYI